MTDRAVILDEAAWRMPISQADGAKTFPIGESGATIAFFSYKDAERPQAGGGIWAMLLVNGHAYVVATTHVFVTTPEKVDPTKADEGKKFYHLHVKPEQIDDPTKPNSLEQHLPLTEAAGWNELDYAVSQISDLHLVRVLLSADGFYDIALAITQEHLTAAATAIRAYYVSEEGIAAAFASEAPDYWTDVQERIAANANGQGAVAA